MKALEPTAEATAVLDEYAAHVRSIQGDADAGLVALLRRVERGDAPPVLVDETPVGRAPRPRQSRLPIAIALVGFASAAAFAALWIGTEVDLRATERDRQNPQAEYQAEGEGVPASAQTLEASAREPAKKSRAPEASTEPEALPVPETIAAPPVEAIEAPIVRAPKPIPRDRLGATKPAAAPNDALAEVRGLARARGALRDGDAAAALRLLGEHRRNHPSSTYDEERDLLFVAALCDAGRREESRAAAARFRSAHPGSPLSAHLTGCPDPSP